MSALIGCTSLGIRNVDAYKYDYIYIYGWKLNCI